MLMEVLESVFCLLGPANTASCPPRGKGCSISITSINFGVAGVSKCEETEGHSVGAGRNVVPHLSLYVEKGRF